MTARFWLSFEPSNFAPCSIQRLMTSCSSLGIGRLGGISPDSIWLYSALLLGFPGVTTPGAFISSAKVDMRNSPLFPCTWHWPQRLVKMLATLPVKLTATFSSSRCEIPLSP
jgi:hypothetical protein